MPFGVLFLRLMLGVRWLLLTTTWLYTLVHVPDVSLHSNYGTACRHACIRVYKCMYLWNCACLYLCIRVCTHTRHPCFYTIIVYTRTRRNWMPQNGWSWPISSHYRPNVALSASDSRIHRNDRYTRFTFSLPIREIIHGLRGAETVTSWWRLHQANCRLLGLAINRIAFRAYYDSRVLCRRLRFVRPVNNAQGSPRHTDGLRSRRSVARTSAGPP